MKLHFCRRFATCGAITPEEQEQRVLYASVLEYEHDHVSIFILLCWLVLDTLCVFVHLFVNIRTSSVFLSPLYWWTVLHCVRDYLLQVRILVWNWTQYMPMLFSIIKKNKKHLHKVKPIHFSMLIRALKWEKNKWDKKCI